MEKTSVALTLVGLNFLSVHLDAMTPASMFSGFLRIADTNTTIPATSGTFDSLSSASFGDGFVTFEGVDGSAINRGLYRSDGTSVTTIVDFNDNIPGLTDTFDQFIGQASLFNGNTLVSVDGTPATFFSGIVSLGRLQVFYSITQRRFQTLHLWLILTTLVSLLSRAINLCSAAATTPVSKEATTFTKVVH